MISGLRNAKLFAPSRPQSRRMLKVTNFMGILLCGAADRRARAQPRASLARSFFASAASFGRVKRWISMKVTFPSSA